MEELSKNVIYYIIGSTFVLFIFILVYSYMYTTPVADMNSIGVVPFMWASFVAGFIVILLTVLCLLFASNMSEKSKRL